MRANGRSESREVAQATFLLRMFREAGGCCLTATCVTWVLESFGLSQRHSMMWQLAFLTPLQVPGTAEKCGFGDAVCCDKGFCYRGDDDIPARCGRGQHASAATGSKGSRWLLFERCS